MRAPEGFVAVTGIGARGFARPEAREWVAGALARWGSLERAGAHADDALELRGRGPVHVVPAPEGGRWVIRRYRRGGWMAPLLGDRYLRRGSARPVRETVASEAARARGIATPRVVAAMAYPAGPFYRADLVTEYVPDSADLARVVFGGDDPRQDPPAEAAHRVAALRGAGGLVVAMARAGIRHRDLNAKNLLVERPAEGDPRLHVLDLDRAAVRPAGTVDPGVMGARLERSLRKLERSRDRSVGDPEWRALAEGLDPGGSP